MSEQPVDERGFLEVTQGVGFGDLMDALVSDAEAEGAGAAGDAGAGAADAGAVPGEAPGTDRGDGEGAAAGSDQAAHPGDPRTQSGDRDGGAAAAEQAPGADAGQQPDTGSTGGDADGSAQQPAADSGPAAVGAVDVSDVLPQINDLTTKLEERADQAFKAEAFKAVRDEYGKYFEALEQHPRLLIGQTVPSPTGEGEETLRDTSDAKEWQDAIKQVLTKEIQGRAETRMDETRGYLDTLHASVDLFKNNTDLIPGTRTFNKELADSFTSFAQPYEIRDDAGKLQGYSIQVQPIIDRLRTQLKPKPQPQQQAAPKPPADPPQASVANKAAQADGGREDYSTLFGTLGLKNFTI